MKSKRDPKTGRFVKSPLRLWLVAICYTGYVGLCIVAGFIGGYFGAGK